MCDACRPVFDRRAILRGVVLGGSAIAAGALWQPGSAHADRLPANGSAAAGSTGAMESASMAEDPSALTAHAMTTTAPADATRLIPAPNLDSLPAPQIVTRKQWGADETIRVDNRSYEPIRKLIVHHTASPNNPSNPAALVRLVEKYHATGRGFTDTGYNYLIDHKGVIYEGRAARRYASGEPITGEDTKGWGVVGAHAKGYNAGSCGICLIGDFDLGSPTDAALSSLVTVLAWKASRHRIDAKRAEEYVDLNGGKHVFANITGHRQVGQTQCPGNRLYKLLPAIRNEVAKRAGSWPTLVVDTPGVLRREYGPLRAPAAGTMVSTTTTSGTAGKTATSGATTGSVEKASSKPSATTNADTAASGVSPGTGTTLQGVRVTTSTGTIYTAGGGRSLGNPASSGIGKVVSLTNSTTGDGYWALGQDGGVAGFGGVTVLGGTTGKGAAVDIAATATGRGYWILLADGGIYPFGDAGYASSPKRAGAGGTALRIAPRLQGDGYWVLMDGGAIHAFGAATDLGAPQDSGTPIDLAATPSGKGYWVLTDAGRVIPFGDAVDKGDLKRSTIHWSKPVAHLLATPSGKGYIIINSEGSMLAFGDAPAYPSFGGSGITATGVAPAYL